MHRLARYEVAARLDRGPSRIISQLLFGVACTLAMVGLRALVDRWFPSSGPFALIYPAIMLATLYGRLPAGLLTYVASFMWAWWAVLPEVNSFRFAEPSDVSRVALNAISALIIVVFAEGFRRAVAAASAERDIEIERRDHLMAELGHRTKNNFALVASLLDIQRRQETNPAMQATLEKAAGRVQSFARAYEHLTDERGEALLIDMRPYLSNLIDILAQASFPANVEIYRELDEKPMAKEQAVAIGLVLNEAMANAAKYAFPDNRPGAVKVRFENKGEAWRLLVEDDGVGGGEGQTGSGIGSDLMRILARQAGGSLSVKFDAGGRRVELKGR